MKKVLILMAIGLIASSASAATITWGTATDLGTAGGNSSDVFATGTLIEAFNAQANDHTPTNVTVNGVTFMGTTELLDADPKDGGTADLSEGTNGGDAAYDTLLSQLEFGGGTAPTIEIGGGRYCPGSTTWYKSGLSMTGQTSTPAL